MREAMKLEYEILMKHEELQKEFAENEIYLVECMKNLTKDATDCISYEALLLLSIFIIRQVSNQKVQ